MELNYIDYLANFHPNIFRRSRAAYKLIFTAVLIAGAIISRSIFWLAGVYLFIIFLILALRLPVFKIWFFSLYSLIFTAVFVFASFSGWKNVLLIALKVNSISLAMIFLIVTTSYPKIFHVLGHFLPQILNSGLYLTYRAMFIFIGLVVNLKNSMTLRGGWQINRPLNSLKNMAELFGFLFVRALDMGQNLADSMRIRGFRGKIHYHEESAHRWGIFEPANLLVIFLTFAVAGTILWLNTKLFRI